MLPVLARSSARLVSAESRSTLLLVARAKYALSQTGRFPCTLSTAKYHRTVASRFPGRPYGPSHSRKKDRSVVEFVDYACLPSASHLPKQTSKYPRPPQN